MVNDQLARPQRMIKRALQAGMVLTTAQGNKLAQTVDFRKIISRLIREGVEVKSYWTETGGRRYKKYYTENPLPAKGTRQNEITQHKLEI